MTKLDAKHINIGTGAKQVNSRVLPANYTADNYVPVPVDSETAAMISAHLKGIDLKLGSITAVSFTDQKFDADGTTEDYLINNPFSATTKIDLFMNGIWQEENRDWKRDASLNKVYMIDESEVKDAWPEDSRIHVRIYDDGFGFTDENVDGAGLYQETYVLSNPFDEETFMEVRVNGMILYENSPDGDYYRTVGTNSIRIVRHGNFGLTEDNRVLIRIGGKSRVDTWFVEEEVLENLQLNSSIEAASRIDVYINGILGKENEDWSRDTANDKINLLDYVQEDFQKLLVLVRVWI